LLNSNNILHGR
jgi:hypothetical protein